MQLKTLKAAVEALIFASTEPINEKTLMDITGADFALKDHDAAGTVPVWKSQYQGIQLSNMAEGYIFTTKLEYREWIEKLLAEQKAAPLSYAAMETLAIIAYKQPVTRGGSGRFVELMQIALYRRWWNGSLSKKSADWTAPADPLHTVRRKTS